MKLNLGSGDMIKEGYINYDAMMWHRGGRQTDVIGRIEDITKVYAENTFSEILCAHVIEHFIAPEALKVLKDILWLLKPGGKAIIEGPDLLGMYDLYITQQNNIHKLIEGIYPIVNVVKYGPEMNHRSGWTRELMGETMAGIGFEVVHVGKGMTHGYDRRDFRVEGVKPGKGAV